MEQEIIKIQGVVVNDGLCIALRKSMKEAIFPVALSLPHLICIVMVNLFYLLRTAEIIRFWVWEIEMENET